MALKHWNIAKADPELSSILAEECGVSLLAASVLAARGHTRAEDAMRFLTPDEQLSSPFDIIDMDRAAERVQAAIDGYEKITVYGDYDCDGVTATAALYTYLSSVGADVAYYLPERDGEGYGLHEDAVREIAAGGTRLLITVDNGISALDEIALAKSLGMDVVVTDHHQPGDTLPDAAAVVDPHREDCACEFRDLAGVGVAFKLIAALEGGDYQTALDYFSDIVAVGTIGDLVPLTGENRVIVKYGLRALSMSDNIGLLALMEAAAVNPEEITAQTVAFSLVPRINAAGRMGSAGLAIRLLLSEEEGEAAELAGTLDRMNRERQESEGTIAADIERMIEADRSILSRRLIILKQPGWNHGILGIACSKLVERYGKPVLLMTGEDGMLRGSARSVGDFHLFKALSANAAVLTRFGGHKMAAGFSLKESDFDAFAEGMEAYARETFDLMPPLSFQVDKALSAEELTLEAISSLSVLEPFGSRNEAPLFLLKEARLESVTPLSGGKHQRLLLRLGGRPVTALCFGVSSERFIYPPGVSLDLLVTAGINRYNGSESVSLRVKDLRPAGFAEEPFFAAKGYYEKIRRGEPVSAAILRRAAPTREEAALVYRFLKTNGGCQTDLDGLFLRLSGYDINYCKLRILLDILEESGLITVSPGLDGVRILPVSGRADLTAAPTWKRVNGDG